MYASDYRLRVLFVMLDGVVNLWWNNASYACASKGKQRTTSRPAIVPRRSGFPSPLSTLSPRACPTPSPCPLPHPQASIFRLKRAGHLLLFAEHTSHAVHSTRWSFGQRSVAVRGM